MRKERFPFPTRRFVEARELQQCSPRESWCRIFWDERCRHGSSSLRTVAARLQAQPWGWGSFRSYERGVGCLGSSSQGLKSHEYRSVIDGRRWSREWGRAPLDRSFVRLWKERCHEYSTVQYSREAIEERREGLFPERRAARRQVDPRYVSQFK